VRKRGVTGNIGIAGIVLGIIFYGNQPVPGVGIFGVTEGLFPIFG